jgi:hypothetical protein
MDNKQLVVIQKQSHVVQYMKIYWKRSLCQLTFTLDLLGRWVSPFDLSKAFRTNRLLAAPGQVNVWRVISIKKGGGGGKKSE